MTTAFAPSTLAELATRLERRRQSAIQLAASLDAEARSALDGVDCSDLLDSDDPTGGTNDVDRDRALSIARLVGATAEAADDAIARMSTGTYGNCHDCGQRIPLARLRAVPDARACVACKSREGRFLALAG